MKFLVANSPDSQEDQGSTRRHVVLLTDCDTTSTGPPTGFYSVNGQMLLASRKANLFSPCQTVCWPRNDTLGPFDQSTYDPLWSKGNQPQPENGNNRLFAGQSGQYNLCGVILIIWHIVDSHFCLFLPVGKTWHKSPNRKWAWPLRFDE